MREEIQPSFLCKDFPKQFSELFQNIIVSKEDDSPNYSEIIKVFENIRDNHENNEGIFKRYYKNNYILVYYFILY